MMIAPTLFSIFVGAALGARFSVLFLIPAIVLAWLFILAGGAAAGTDVESIIATMLLSGGGMEIGYFVGAYFALLLLRRA